VDIDEQIAALLRQDIPPAHDPMFRLRVLERLEQRRFRRRLVTALIAAAVLAATIWAGATARNEFPERMGVLLLCIALLLSCFMHAPVVFHFARKLRDEVHSRN
jgi:hypothetical protein